MAKRPLLTEKAIRNAKLPPPGERVEIWCGRTAGLHVRISYSAGKCFYVRYRVGARQRRQKLGTYPQLSVKDARAMADDVLASVRKGGDPQAERREERRRAEIARRSRVADLASNFLDHQRRVGRRSVGEMERQLVKDVLPRLGELPAAEVTEEHVQATLDTIARRGPVQAVRTRAVLGSMFKFATRDRRWRAVVTENPVRKTTKPQKKERPRERQLSDDELRRLWTTTGKLDPIVGAAYKMRLLTGQRWGEVRSMRWSEIYGESVAIGGRSTEVEVWHLPGAVTKNGRPHKVPLSPQARTVLRDMREVNGECTFAFASPRKRDQPIGVAGRAFARWREAAQVEDFKGVDLRHAAVSGMARAGVRLEVIQQVMNHSPADITRRVYLARDSLLAEVAQALNLWGAHVDRVVAGKSGNNVVRIA